MPRKPSPQRQLHLLESPPRMIFDVETEEGLQEILGIFVSFCCCCCPLTRSLEKDPIFKRYRAKCNTYALLYLCPYIYGKDTNKIPGSTGVFLLSSGSLPETCPIFVVKSVEFELWNLQHLISTQEREQAIGFDDESYNFDVIFYILDGWM